MLCSYGNFLNKDIDIVYYDDGHGSLESKNGKIERFAVNGEMGMIAWYRQGNKEINGKYVTEIRYKN